MKTAGRLSATARPGSSLARLLCALPLAAGIALAAPPVVTNVWFAQRTNSNLVDIWYDVSDPDGDDVFEVRIAFSNDNGSTWKVVPRSVSGPVGPNQTPGKKKRVIWDAGKDYPNLRGSDFICRVTADDGITPPPVQSDTPYASRPTPEPKPGTPAGMRFLQRNQQGYDEYLWLKDSSVMVKVPAGQFWMGSAVNEGGDDERPQHQLYLGEYYIDKYEVTNRQFVRFVQAEGYRTDAEKEGNGWVYDTDSSKWVSKSGVSWRTFYSYGTENHPVVLVSWNDAKAYCDWAGKRLPTEAEWEKAARGATPREYPWGDEAPDAGGVYRANWGEGSDPSVWRRDGYEFTAPVGTYPKGASPYGCLDMAGNVWEWCNDWYDGDYYGSSAASNPQGPSSGSSRVLRGGSWYFDARVLRCANRNGYEPSERDDDFGFRSSH